MASAYEQHALITHYDFLYTEEAKESYVAAPGSPARHAAQARAALFFEVLVRLGANPATLARLRRLPDHRLPPLATCETWERPPLDKAALRAWLADERSRLAKQTFHLASRAPGSETSEATHMAHGDALCQVEADLLRLLRDPSTADEGY
jgi:hypothetical protein